MKKAFSIMILLIMFATVTGVFAEQALMQDTTVDFDGFSFDFPAYSSYQVYSKEAGKDYIEMKITVPNEDDTHGFFSIDVFWAGESFDNSPEIAETYMNAYSVLDNDRAKEQSSHFGFSMDIPVTEYEFTSDPAESEIAGEPCLRNEATYGFANAYVYQFGAKGNIFILVIDSAYDVEPDNVLSSALHWN